MMFGDLPDDDTAISTSPGRASDSSWYSKTASYPMSLAIALRISTFVDRLVTRFGDRSAPVTAVDGVSFDIRPGEIFGLVGESGCGKSATCRSLIRLFGGAAVEISGGAITFDGLDLTRLSDRQMEDIRGARIAMIFQDPMTALNPHLNVGTQLAEVLVAHRGQSWSAATAEAMRMLQAVRIPEAGRRLRQYPHELSGGQRQRVMIAMALLCRPQLLIADEPTTALDVTVQTQILRLLDDLSREFGLALVLITHDLGVVARICRRTLVMYGGRLMEQGASEAVLSAPLHPYTEALIASRPRLDGDVGKPLQAIAGSPPSPADRLPGCPFAPRCPRVRDICRQRVPALATTAERECACHAVTV